MPKKLFLSVLSLILALLLPFSVQAADESCDFKLTDASICDIGACLPTGMSADDCKSVVELFQGQTDGPWYNQSMTQFASKVTNPDNEAEIFGERYTYAQINWILNSVATMLNPAAGIDNPGKLLEFLNKLKGLTASLQNNGSPSFKQYADLGPAGVFAGGMAMLYNSPVASGIGDVKATASKILDIGTGVQPAYAQGYGFSGLNSGGAVRALWSASRNMSYLIIVILLIASGFLIMFRVKINPQTVVSLQVMIPKLVITLILVTFSFAIAGFVIDFIYVFIAAFVAMLSLSTPNIIAPGSVGQAINWLATGEFGSYVGLQIGNSAMLIVMLTIGGFLALGWGGLLIFNLVAGVIGIIVGIALAIWMLVILVKIFLMLIKSYVTLILLICIGPLQIMMDLIPGQQGFGPWIRNVISNASVFAVVPIMLVIQHIIAWNPITNNVLGITDFNALGNVNLGLPFLNGTLKSTDILYRMIISYTIFSMTPKIADMVRDALKVPAFKYGADFDGAKPALGMAASGVQTKLSPILEKGSSATETEKRLAKLGMAGVGAIKQLTNTK